MGVAAADIHHIADRQKELSGNHIHGLTRSLLKLHMVFLWNKSPFKNILDQNTGLPLSVGVT